MTAMTISVRVRGSITMGVGRTADAKVVLLPLWVSLMEQHKAAPDS
jgi:hypothetical protein